MFQDLLQDVLEILIWFQTVCPGGLCDTVQDRAGRCTGFRSRQIPVLLPCTESPDAALRIVVVHRDDRVIKEFPQIRFLIVRVIQRTIKIAAFIHGMAHDLIDPLEECIDQWSDRSFPVLQDLLQWL